MNSKRFHVLYVADRDLYFLYLNMSCSTCSKYIWL